MEIIKLEVQMKVYTSHAAYKIFNSLLCSFYSCVFTWYGTQDCTDRLSSLELKD